MDQLHRIIQFVIWINWIHWNKRSIRLIWMLKQLDHHHDNIHSLNWILPRLLSGWQLGWQLGWAPPGRQPSWIVGRQPMGFCRRRLSDLCGCRFDSCWFELLHRWLGLLCCVVWLWCCCSCCCWLDRCCLVGSPIARLLIATGASK